MEHLRTIKNLLVCIFIIIAFGAVYFARDMLLPVVIGLILALTLSPLVRGFGRFGIPNVVSAFVLIFGAALAAAGGAYLASGPITEILANAPEMGAELRQKLSGVMQSLSDIQDASDQVEEIANGGDSAPTVAIKQPGLLAFAAGSVANFVGLTLVGLVLALLILASGDLFYVKLIEALPNFADKRRAVRTVRDIERQISHYFLAITGINAGLGLSITIAMYLAGLPNPLLWGLLGFALNFLPFVGAIIGVVAVAAFGILSFDTIGAGLFPAFIYLVLSSIEGQFVTPTMLGRRLELNTVSVFLTVIVWSWLWSVPGALMAVPFLVLLKVICDNIPTLATFGSFLGARSQTDIVREAAP